MHMSTQMPNVDIWDMLNNCLYVQKSLFVGENGNGFQLGTSSMNSKVTGEGDAAVKKKPLQFSAINTEF